MMIEFPKEIDSEEETSMWMQRSIWLMEWSYRLATCEKIMSFKQEWSEEESLAIKYPFSSNRKNIRFLRASYFA